MLSKKVGKYRVSKLINTPGNVLSAYLVYELIREDATTVTLQHPVRALEVERSQVYVVRDQEGEIVTQPGTNEPMKKAKVWTDFVFPIDSYFTLNKKNIVLQKSAIEYTRDLYPTEALCVSYLTQIAKLLEEEAAKKEELANKAMQKENAGEKASEVMQ